MRQEKWTDLPPRDISKAGDGLQRGWGTTLSAEAEDEPAVEEYAEDVDSSIAPGNRKLEDYDWPLDSLRVLQGDPKHLHLRITVVEW